MRYVLDDNGYVEAVSCNPFECNDKGCTEYKGLIPLGYYSLTEWVEKANIRAYKIVDGTFTYDSDRAAALQLEMELSNNEVVLYENESGSSGTLTLKDTFTNYDYIEVLGERSDTNQSAYGKFIPSNNHICSVYACNFNSTSLTIYANTLTFNDKSVTQTGGAIALWSSNGGVAGVAGGPEIRIQKIIGYKHKLELETFEEPDLSIDANIPVEPDIPTYTMADSWRPYNNCSIDGSTIKDNLNAWVSASNDGNFKGLSLDFTLTETHNLKASFEFAGYEGCPKHQTIWILKDDSEWLHEFTMYFDDLGTNFTRTINQVLETGSYKLIIGSYGAMDFGLKCTEVSLSTEIPQNLFDLSSYSFPTTKDGLTFNYDNEEKTLTINGESNDDFGLYIPLSLPPGNYTISYLPNQSDLGFYFSIDEISDSMLTGWGRNNKTFDVTSTTSQIILWFDAWYVYNNLELKFNLVKND